MLLQNEGALDRVMRFTIGAILGVLIFTTLTGVWQIVVAVVATILLVTGLVGFCPLYALLRFDTRGARNVATRR